MGSAVLLASDITITLIKLLCSFGHCWPCDSPLSFLLLSFMSVSKRRGCFLKVGKVRIDGGLWLFYCGEASEKIKPKSMRNSYKWVCGFTVRKEMCFYFIMIWWNKMKWVWGLCWKWYIRRTRDTWTQTYKVQKTPKVPLYLNFKVTNKSSLSWHGEDFNFKSQTYPVLGGRTEPLLCSPDFMCPPSSGAASSSSVYAQLNSLRRPTDQLVQE